MLKFVPFDDLTNNANDATNITELNYGNILAGETATNCFRLASNSLRQSWRFVIPNSESAEIEVSPATGVIEAGKLSDTITVVVSPPIDASSAGRVVDLIATTDEGSYALTLVYNVIGANETRSSQYPERATDFTDNVSGVVYRVSEPLRNYRYDPIAYDPADRRVFIIPTDRRKLDGSPPRLIGQNINERLNPLNETWGYRRAESIILGSFQEEHTTVSIPLAKDNSSLTFQSTALLVVPAEYELPRVYALFSLANDPDKNQYKRTVYLLQRAGITWCVWQVYARYRGNELAHYECELIELQNATQGGPLAFNPFAFTFSMESDRPYGYYPVDYGELFPLTGEDASGSAGGS